MRVWREAGGRAGAEEGGKREREREKSGRETETENERNINEKT